MALASKPIEREPQEQPEPSEPIEHHGLEHEVAKPYDFFEPVEDDGEEHPVVNEVTDEE
jgi:hypothetical protein